MLNRAGAFSGVSWLKALVALWLATSVHLTAQTNGIYADFVTSLGTFTCQLDYTNAPKTVANFIGLATGTRAWLDGTSGKVRTNAFYDGLTFHRVITNFMIQGGSPNGLGTDGPGYAILDEFSPAQKFDGAGVLAMANSGPNTGGSQFFVTVTNTSWLNALHAIFGRVVSGQAVVNAIDLVPTDANNRPLTNVVLQHVAIRRVGSAAQAFDSNAQNLPVVSARPLAMTRAGANVNLIFTNLLFADSSLGISTNLTTWSGSDLGFNMTATTNQTLSQSLAGSRGFYKLAQTQYPAWPIPSASPGTLKLTLTFTMGLSGTATYQLTNGVGTCVFSLYGSSTVTSYSWGQSLYGGYLWPVFSYFPPIGYQLNFTNSISGTFGGKVFDTSTYGIAGTFILSTP